MRFPDFLINVFTRFAPVDAQTLSNLKVHLSDNFNMILNNAAEKAEKNKTYADKAAEITKELSELDTHTPEYEKKLFELNDLSEKMLKPTLIERVVQLLENPWVRVLLLVSFGFVTRWIAKKLTEVKEPAQDQEEVVKEQAPYQQPYYHQSPPPNFYNPYGWMPPQGNNPIK